MVVCYDAPTDAAHKKIQNQNQNAKLRKSSAFGGFHNFDF